MKECNKIEKELTKFETGLKVNKAYLKEHERTISSIRKCSKVHYWNYLVIEYGIWIF